MIQTQNHDPGHRLLKRAVSFVIVAKLSMCALNAQSPIVEPGGSSPNARHAAPIDLTGYWVSVVTEDWRYRMVTPAPGDYESVPITAAARRLADMWDPARDEASGDVCRSYGAPALLRIPGHIRIAWQDDQTLRLETDSGMQKRFFHFGNWESANEAPSLQGDSVAHWRFNRSDDAPTSNAPDATSGFLIVTTTHLKPGYLRKNGVPYGQNAALLEYYDLVKEPGEILWMVVTTIVTDPEYLREPFVVSSHFKKQADDSGWNATPCSARW